MICELKSGGASCYPDEGVCKFSLLILVMSQSSQSILDHIAEMLRFISNNNRSGLHSIRAITMAAT